ncbi:MAG: 6-pyruvoyl trahydropterin synthase family protein [Planctomycetota bacterium]
MYTVSVTTSFCATHRVGLEDGTLERLHGHDWRICACFARAQLNEMGMVVDFVAAKAALDAIAARWHHRDLNDHVDFADQTPTAEIVARAVFDSLWDAGFDSVTRVEVTEAPGCVATYEATAPG